MTATIDVTGGATDPTDPAATTGMTGTADGDVLTPRRLRELGVLGAAEVHVADVVARLTGDADPLVSLGTALAVRAPAQGHVCLELDRLLADGLTADGLATLDLPLPDLDPWLAALRGSPAVRPSDDDRDATPLVLDGTRLYLDRYWRAEGRLVRGLARRLGRDPDDRDPAAASPWLDRLFPPPADGAHDRQRQAAEVALRRRVTVLTGGPGTGKTTTVVRLLAVLLATAPAGARPRMVLAAPTGKAAARMQQAVRDGVDALDLDEPLRDELRRIPASTIHRLLGWRPGEPTRFHHGPGRPLDADVVVVDEASMASLTLMADLVDALPTDVRLVLVGDRDQLTSVEAGAVLGDLCGPRGGVAPDDGIVHLDRFHRFGSDSGIGATARAIQRLDEDPGEVLGLLRGERIERDRVTVPDDAGYPDLSLVAPDRLTSLPAPVRDLVVDAAVEAVELALAGAPALEVLAAHDRVQVLAALRRGPHGVHALNRDLDAALRARVLAYRDGGELPIGLPLLVTRNDRELGIFNGDVGVVVPDPDDPHRRRVAFPAADGGVRSLAPARLPEHEPVFAMSIHKSQGSQYRHVVVVLPDRPSPLLSRELVYTGVTRARDRVTVVADEPVLRAALVRRVQRASGLRARLWATRHEDATG